MYYALIATHIHNTVLYPDSIYKLEGTERQLGRSIVRPR